MLTSRIASIMESSPIRNKSVFACNRLESSSQERARANPINTSSLHVCSAAPTVTTSRIQRRISRSPRTAMAWRIDLISRANPKIGEFRQRSKR